MNFECYRASLRLASLPQTHPLAPHVRRASRHLVTHHRSPLHNLFHTFNINTDSMEKIDSVGPAPDWKPPFKTHIASEKKIAL
ncbi:hypothetical protein NEOLEDRAFT_1087167 [Neolentinus lepideus HHB14362 ss-1]|uniref:Uncharacterized protein n=1 Tax=Neolentinus lepideus HHB14362 ss-1 TaxID=1314782 RepID=A0A165UI59_9AGAM|nr:hypothetical protein NEOLEDRAFT_1087167 [Neolentinus lepideus HHB14362 ss-1]